jgi:hypothetical protein
VGKLAIIAAGLRPAAEIAEHSRSSLDRRLVCDAELWLAVATDEARIWGAFQRVGEPSQLVGHAGHAGDAGPAGHAGSGIVAKPALPGVRRGSGGPEVLVGPGTVHVALSLANPASLGASDEKRIVNRCVRPLLRAMAAMGSPAAFFGRDWISVSKLPAAWAGFGHDSATGRTLFEAFVAVASPFAPPGRGSFRGKIPGSLQSIAGRAVDPARVARAVADAYAEGHDVLSLQPAPPTDPNIGSAGEARSEPPWAATCEEAIGVIGAGRDARGVFRVGGDLLVSRDALSRLETRTALIPEDEIGPAVDGILLAPGVALDGIRTLASLRDVIVRARRGIA